MSRKVSNFKYTANKRGKPVTDSIGREQNLSEKLDLLKTLVVSNDNVEQILSILNETAQLRQRMIKQAIVEFIIQFPIFFTHPEFVGFNRIWIKPRNPRIRLMKNVFLHRFYMTSSSDSPKQKLPDSLTNGHYLHRLQKMSEMTSISKRFLHYGRTKSNKCSFY